MSIETVPELERDRSAYVPSDVLVHRPPMQLLHRLLDHDAAALTAEILVAPTHPFVDQGVAPALLAIEYLAQAVAAHQGALDRDQGREPCEGLLLGSRRLRIHMRELRVGQRLSAHVQRDFHLGAELGRYLCRLTDLQSGACLAEGELKVFQSRRAVAELKAKATHRLNA